MATSKPIINQLPLLDNQTMKFLTLIPMATSSPPLTTHFCELCKSRQNLSRCSLCNVVWYCSRDHQMAHRSVHEQHCNSIEQNKAHTDAVRRNLNHHDFDLVSIHLMFHQTDGFVPIGGFVPGTFCTESNETRAYLVQRNKLVEALLKVQTTEAVETALSHMMEMFRLSFRSNSLSLRGRIPALLLQLGREQECYDFLKRWQYGSEVYDERDRVPKIVKNADIFEPASQVMTSNLGVLIATTLLKVKLIIDLHFLHSTRNPLLLPCTLPQELFDLIRSNGVGQAIKSRRCLIDGHYDLGPGIDYLFDDFLQLYDAVNYQNRLFWPTLINADPNHAIKLKYHHETTDPNMGVAIDNIQEQWVEGERVTYGPVRFTEKEMRFYMDQHHAAWAETPGAIAIVRKVVEEGWTHKTWYGYEDEELDEGLEDEIDWRST
ncbi:hypothetical protein F4819DRAFT_492450 [Hypoxylon fuscum]|nr:hypothetical protein F4819DRAFT_492450 [Hypoxylon fuscum]